MSLILSIDVGTTNIKAGVVADDGRLLLLRKSKIPVHEPEFGAAEHDPEELFELLLSISKDVVSKYQNEISQIVLSTYQFGLLMLDSEMKPIGGISLLSDMRARDNFNKMLSEFNEDVLYHETGCPPIFQYPLFRLLHFKKTKPEVFKKAKYFLTSKEYLIYRLTGELIGEPSTACASQLMDIHTLKWNEKVLSHLEITPENFPEQYDGMTTLRKVIPSVTKTLGISENINLLLGLYDSGALAVGLSGLESSIGIINLGTSAFLRVPGEAPVFDKSGLKQINPYALREGLYVNGGSLNNAALPLDWLREKLFDIDLKDSEIIERDDHRSPLFSLPYLTGERNPGIGSHASGVFFGLRPTHSRADVARSLLEGVAFSLCFVRDALIGNDFEIREYRMAGGGASWKVWPQIFANVFNAPMVVPKAKEIALVGSAMLGFTALGRFSSLDEASEHMLNYGERINPQPEKVSIYQEYYAFYKELCSAMVPLYVKHGRLVKDLAHD